MTDVWGLGLGLGPIRDRVRGSLGDVDPPNKVPFKRARSRVQKGPLQGVP